MKTAMPVALCLAVLLSPLPGIAGDKVHSVPADGLTIEGSHPDGDMQVKVEPVPDKSVSLPAKLHQVKLAAGKSYTITMNSKEELGKLDPVVVVQDSTGKQLAFDDDSGGELNSRLHFTPMKADTFKVYAAALNGAGKYIIKITAQDVKVGDPAAGVKVDGEISKADRSQAHHVKFAQGKTYVIDMIAQGGTNLDPFLRLVNPSGKIIAQDDDGGEGLNSRITIEAKEAGIYQIVATAVNGQGRYMLTVREKQ